MNRRILPIAMAIFASALPARALAANSEEPLIPPGLKSRSTNLEVTPVPSKTKTPNINTSKPPVKNVVKPTKLGSQAKPKEPEVDPETDVLQEQARVIEFANTHLQKLRWDAHDRKCADCYATSAGTEDSTLSANDPKQMCVDKWKDFYNTGPEDPNCPDGPKKPVDIRMVLGHLDADFDSFVSDGVLRQSMVETVTAACEANNLVRVCGFKRSTTNADVFEREILGPGNVPQKIRLTLKASSSSSSDELSKQNQEARSAAAEKTYYDGIKEADVLFYVGHARGGGGPDFRPRVPGKSLAQYRKEQTGINTLNAVLQSSKVNGKKKTPKIMGFLACDAGVWEPSLKRNAPESALILSRTDQVESQTALGMAYVAIDSILWQRCPDEFDKALNILIDYRKQKLVPLSLDGFFNK